MTNPPSSLFLVLRSYRPRDNHDPLENFVTAAFAWLLENHPGFAAFYLNKITGKLGIPEIAAETPLCWDMQADWGVIPDLVCDAGGHHFIFEHKVHSYLHGLQLANYRRLGEAKFGQGKFHIVRVTRDADQHTQQSDTDAAFCWHEVHGWIKQWLAQAPVDTGFLFDDFCSLLDGEGIGPRNAITLTSVVSYIPARTFLPNLVGLLRLLKRHSWQDYLPPGLARPFAYERRGEWYTNRWGRMGLDLLGGDVLDFLPGIFLGVYHNTWDHSAPQLVRDIPDFAIIVTVNKELHPRYDESPAYKAMVQALGSAIRTQAPGFDFHHHLESPDTPKNRWHPLHIRRCLLDVLRGTRTAEDQRQRCIEQGSHVLQLITQCQPFWDWRAELQASKPA